MAKIMNGSSTQEGLRERAETALPFTSVCTDCGNAPGDLSGLLHELRVHQIELELQNEDLRRAQVELEHSRARYVELFDLAPVGYCTLNDEGLVVDVNLMAATLFGSARSELRRLPFTSLVEAEHQDVYYLRRKLLLETASLQAFELLLKRRGGASFWAWIDARLSRRSDGMRLIHIAVTDITAQKLTEAELRNAANGLEQRVLERSVDLSHSEVGLRNEIARRKVSEERLLRSEEQLRAILDTAAEAIITCDRDGQIELFNVAAERMFGWELDDVAGKAVEVLMPPGHASQNLTLLGQFLANDQRQPTGTGREIIGMRKDGTTFEVDVSVSEFVTGNDRKITAILRDLTERRRLEDHLRQAQKMEAVARLASGISHDFNNLLMGVIGCCKVASAQLPSDHGAAQPIEEIRGAAERGAALTRQLLNFGRKQASTAVPMRLNKIVGTVASIVTNMLGEDIKLEVELCETGGPILGDPNGLEQVLMNLAVNARDAMRQGGTLRLATAETELPEATEMRSGTLPAGRYVQLVVEDSGCGIRPEIQEHVFEPFFTTKPAGEGSGLGLYSVYGIVERLGGAVDLQSELGFGTKLTILLPRDSSTDTKLPSGLTKAAGELIRSDLGQRVTILVAEDERLIRLAVNHMLARHKFHVLMAETFEDSLRVAREYPGTIDVLLTDMVLPGGNGSALADALRRERPGLSVVYMSAYPNEVLVQQGRIPPGAPSLEKPFDDERLADALRLALNRKSEIASVVAA